MKNVSLVLSLLLATVLHSFAQTTVRVDEATARQTAQLFVNAETRFQSTDLELVSASNIFVYNIGKQGFVIVSGSQVLPPVLGWSDQGCFPDMTDAPDNVRSWLDHYGAMIDFAEANHLQPEPSVRREWDEAAQGRFVKGTKTVNPLVNTRWNQDCYYNEYCPATSGGWGGGPCGHVYAGCVACAMAQVMKYWDYPTTGFGSHSYTHSTYGEQSANFGATTYHWDEMPNSVNGHNDAVATLMYHCGVSVDMNYAPDGSGAYSADVETAMRSYFGYCGARYRQKSNYSDEEWIAMVEAELDLSRPLYYSGSSSSSGHAFVCDGYDNSDRLHFNFGWSGSSDGYYTIYSVNGFNQNQAVVMNVYPMNIQADANGIIYVSPDGTGDGSSWDDATDKLEFATALSSGGSTKVWVKTGTYYGDTTDTEGAFRITAGNRIYGGFEGNEAPDFDLALRDFEKNPTILDGQNARRVLLQDEAFNAATMPVWDGFTIQNGSIGTGAGAYLNNYVTLSNCIIVNNAATMFGGGVYINSTGGTARVTLSNCSITDNSASMGGGVCDRIGADYTNCRISNNTATTKGGGIYLYMNTEPTLKNCVVSNNTAKDGGGLYARGRFTAYNCDFVMNLATESTGGVFNEERHNKYYNCILWGNMADGQPSQTDGVSDYEYCAVQGGVEGTENISLPAENEGMSHIWFNHIAEGAGAGFVNDDWSLNAVSVGLNAGKPNTTGLGATDIAGNPRIQKGRVEIGAYESCATKSESEATTCDNEPYLFDGQELTESGMYIAILNGSDCDSVVRLTLSVMESPVVGIEGDNTVPVGGSVTLTATGADSYLWSTGETTESITVSPTENTTYSVVGTNENGCSNEAEFAVTMEQGTHEATTSRLKAWPNPTTGILHLDGDDINTVEVSDILGQRVLHSENTETIDLSRLENGVYFLIVKDKEGFETVVKVIKR